MNSVFSRLLEGDPAVRYVTRRDLLKEDCNSDSMKKLALEVLKMEEIQSLFDELQSWPGKALKSHRDAKHLIHKLAFLADLGFTPPAGADSKPACDPFLEHKALAPVIEKILAGTSPDGPFTILINIPKPFGGSGKDSPGWMLCDAAVVLYALIKMGFASHKKVEKAFIYLLSLVRENGWPCAAGSELGKKFKGPGKREDPCPYVNLLMLRALSAHPDYRDSKESRMGIGALFDLWDKQKETKPFLFAMGTDFKKLKYPFIWYDILFTADVLSRFEMARKDSRLLQMAEIIMEKKKNEGLFKAESVWQAFKGWDFGQKRVPSLWITFLAYRIAERMGMGKEIYEEGR